MSSNADRAFVESLGRHLETFLSPFILLSLTQALTPCSFSFWFVAIGLYGEGFYVWPSEVIKVLCSLGD